MWVLGQLFEIALVVIGLVLVLAAVGGVAAYFGGRKSRRERRLRDRVREEAGYSEPPSPDRTPAEKQRRQRKSLGYD